MKSLRFGVGRGSTPLVAALAMVAGSACYERGAGIDFGYYPPEDLGPYPNAHGHRDAALPDGEVTLLGTLCDTRVDSSSPRDFLCPTGLGCGPWSTYGFVCDSWLCTPEHDETCPAGMWCVGRPLWSADGGVYGICLMPCLSTRDCPPPFDGGAGLPAGEGYQCRLYVPGASGLPGACVFAGATDGWGPELP